MTERTEKRTGTERAAILLLTLGEQEAAQVLKHMGAREVQRLGAAMAQLKGITRDEVSEILAEFANVVENQTSFGVGVDEFLRKVLVEALGEDKAASIIERINIGRSSKGLEALKWMDPRAVAELIRLEHPQIIAIVLAYLDPDHSAEILSHLPANLRAEVLIRIATLDGVQPSALSELDDVMEKTFAGNSSGKTSVLGGAKAAANIINFLDAAEENAIISEIAKSDEALATRIQDLIFMFDDLVELDDRSMQELLRNVPSDRLVIALKAADEDLKQKIFKNMSQRAAEMLRDDLEARGPVRLSEVEAAQKEIIAIARRLAESGVISLSGKTEEYV
jgi:flagellar motor switch protein FliG|nr:MAG: flagellar motor switch protein FliG [Pseudomonadota bacterium]